MATIDVTRPHNHTLTEARKRAEDLAKDVAAKMPVIQYHWEDDAIKFVGMSGMAKGATGVITVGANTVRVEIILPFLLRVMKGVIERELIEGLTKACA